MPSKFQSDTAGIQSDTVRTISPEASGAGSVFADLLSVSGG